MQKGYTTISRRWILLNNDSKSTNYRQQFHWNRLIGNYDPGTLIFQKMLNSSIFEQKISFLLVPTKEEEYNINNGTNFIKYWKTQSNKKTGLKQSILKYIKSSFFLSKKDHLFQYCKKIKHFLKNIFKY